MLVANYEVVVFAEDDARLNAHRWAGEYVLLREAHVAAMEAIRDDEVSRVEVESLRGDHGTRSRKFTWKIVKIPRVVD